jgi:hypothetical protein
MDKKLLKISFNKNGNGSLTPKISLPKAWTDSLKITPEERSVEVIRDEAKEEIIIRKAK